MNVTPHVCQNGLCDEVLRLRQQHWRYAAIGRALTITLYTIRRIVEAHTRLRCRDGAASCLDCRRMVDAKVPTTQLVPADECCPWCARRYDGDSRNVTPLLARLASSEAPATGARPVQDLRVWDVRVRANSAEVRSRPSARGQAHALQAEE